MSNQDTEQTTGEWFDRKTFSVPCLAYPNDKLCEIEFVWPERVSGSKNATITVSQDLVFKLEDVR